MNIILLLTIFIIHINAIEYKCTPKGTKYSEGFNSIDGITDCSKIEKETYYFTSSFTFDQENVSFHKIIIEGTVTFNTTFELKEDSSLDSFIKIEYLYLHPNAKFYFENIKIEKEIIISSNSFLFPNSRVIISGNINVYFVNIETPQIISWESDKIYLLNKSIEEYPLTIMNPEDNFNCFDLMSLSDSNQMMSDKLLNTNISPQDFPFKITSGTLYLVAQNRLIRYCPGKIAHSRTDIHCPMRNGNYTNQFEKGMIPDEYPFYYPHCPCDNNNTNCYLVPEANVKDVYLKGISLKYTTVQVLYPVVFHDVSEI